MRHPPPHESASKLNATPRRRLNVEFAGPRGVVAVVAPAPRRVLRREPRVGPRLAGAGRVAPRRRPTGAAGAAKPPCGRRQRRSAVGPARTSVVAPCACRRDARCKFDWAPARTQPVQPTVEVPPHTDRGVFAPSVRRGHRREVRVRTQLALLARRAAAARGIETDPGGAAPRHAFDPQPTDADLAHHRPRANRRARDVRSLWSWSAGRRARLAALRRRRQQPSSMAVSDPGFTLPALPILTVRRSDVSSHTP